MLDKPSKHVEGLRAEYSLLLLSYTSSLKTYKMTTPEEAFAAILEGERTMQVKANRVAAIGNGGGQGQPVE